MIIAIDPGLTRTGIVVMKSSGEVVAYATFAADDPHGERQHRAWDLAEAINDWLWVNHIVDEPDDEEVVLVIEKPIVGKNIENFEKQMRVFTAIISIMSTKVDLIVEVTPTKMKRAVTGNGAASKVDIVNASPFDGPGEWVGEGMFTKKQREAEEIANQEAVADAWGIGASFLKNMWDAKYAPHVNNFAARGPIIEKVY